MFRIQLESYTYLCQVAGYSYPGLRFEAKDFETREDAIKAFFEFTTKEQYPDAKIITSEAIYA